MRRRATRERRKAIVALVAVLAAGVVGATAVYLTGSNQRREDRAAYLEYERRLLPALAEGGRIVETEMKPSLREAADAQIAGAVLVQRAHGWRIGFERVRRQVLALTPPPFMRDVERRWETALNAYLGTVEALAAAGAAVDSELGRLLEEAAAAGERASRLFDRGAELMQFHRRRLGLGPTRRLPDP